MNTPWSLSQSDVAERLGISVVRVQQIEASALAKLGVLLAGEELAGMEEEELRLVVAQARNAASSRPRHPLTVRENFRARRR